MFLTNTLAHKLAGYDSRTQTFSEFSVSVKLRGTLQLGAEAEDKHTKQGCYIDNMTESFLCSVQCRAPPLLFPSLLFPAWLSPSLFSMPVCLGVPRPLSLSLPLHLRPVCRYIPSPLAAFAVPGDTGGEGL